MTASRGIGRGRGPQQLTGEQQAALELVREADEAFRQARRLAEIRYRKQIEEEVTLYSSKRDLAVQRAYEIGVPKSRIGRDGLGTTSPNTVYDILRRVEDTVELVGVEFAPEYRARFSWSAEVVIGDRTFRYLLDSKNPTAVSQALGDVPEHEGYRYGLGFGGVWGAISTGIPEEAVKWAEVNS